MQDRLKQLPNCYMYQGSLAYIVLPFRIWQKLHCISSQQHYRILSVQDDLKHFPNCYMHQGSLALSGLPFRI